MLGVVKDHFPRYGTKTEKNAKFGDCYKKRSNTSCGSECKFWGAPARCNLRLEMTRTTRRKMQILKHTHSSFFTFFNLKQIPSQQVTLILDKFGKCACSNSLSLLLLGVTIANSQDKRFARFFSFLILMTVGWRVCHHKLKGKCQVIFAAL